MATKADIRISPQAYLAAERAATFKSEYLDGQVYAMTGASRRHNLIAGNITVKLGAQLWNRPCEIYAADMRLKVSATGLYTYPDVMIACDTPRFDDEHRDTLLNPIVIVEVLSQSTADYDRGAKFEHYRTLPSLIEYILMAQDRHHVEQFTRQADNRWLLTETNEPQDTIHLASVGCELTLVEIYHKVAMVAGDNGQSSESAPG